MTNKFCHAAELWKPLIFEIGFPNVLQSFDEVVKNFGGHHNPVTVGAHFFCDTNHPASGIAFEVDEKGLAIRDDFFCANDIVFHFSERAALLYAPLLTYYITRAVESINKWKIGQSLCKKS